MKIDAVIFDLDHTLFDRYKTLELCAPVLLDRYRDVFDPAYDITRFTSLMKEADKNRIHYGWDALFDYYEEKGLIRSGQSFDRKKYLEDLLDTYGMFAVRYDFTRDILLTLRKMGLCTGLITNGTGTLQRKKLSMLGITDCFDEILISGEYGTAKPDTGMFTEMARRLGFSPDRMLYVGDHPKNDADTSRRAGYIPILVKAMGFLTMPIAETFPLVIGDIRELIPLIEDRFA